MDFFPDIVSDQALGALETMFSEIFLRFISGDQLVEKSIEIGQSGLFSGESLVDVFFGALNNFLLNSDITKGTLMYWVSFIWLDFENLE